MQWIKVEDQLPPNTRRVIVAIWDPRPKVEMYFIHVAIRLNDFWYDPETEQSICTRGSYVTHWMPLPDKPKD